jgi:hypothetical protein
VQWSETGGLFKVSGMHVTEHTYVGGMVVLGAHGGSYEVNQSPRDLWPALFPFSCTADCLLALLKSP